MKIDVKNSELLANIKNYKLMKKAKAGLAVGVIAAGIGACAMKSDGSVTKTVPTTITAVEAAKNINSINVTMDQINDLNLIINDNDCGNTFFDNICKKLEADGIEFTRTAKCKDLDQDDSVVVSIDEQYSSGPCSLVLGPYTNNNNNNSDALSICMNVGLFEYGFPVENVLSGEIGYSETNYGGVTQRVPTNTEESIPNYCNTSYTTISFGTQNKDYLLAAASIENGLARYAAYVNSNENDFNTDLLYRTESEDTIDSLCTKFGATINEINNTNRSRFTEDSLKKDMLIMNPASNDIKEFDTNASVTMTSKENVHSR